jgi:chromate transporter
LQPVHRRAKSVRRQARPACVIGEKESHMETPRPLARPASLREMFCAFTLLALQGFGGVLAVSQRMLCERKRWMSHKQYVSALALAQVLPGPNVCNLALIVGDRFFGWRGAFTALAALMAAPLVLVLALTVVYAHYAAVPEVSGALKGMGAVSAGLVVSTGLKLIPALRDNAMRLPACLLFGGAAFVAITVMGWPLAGVLFGIGSAACAVAWWRIGAAPRATAAKERP